MTINKAGTALVLVTHDLPSEIERSISNAPSHYEKIDLPQRVKEKILPMLQEKTYFIYTVNIPQPVQIPVPISVPMPEPDPVMQHPDPHPAPVNPPVAEEDNGQNNVGIAENADPQPEAVIVNPPPENREAHVEAQAEPAPEGMHEADNSLLLIPSARQQKSQQLQTKMSSTPLLFTALDPNGSEHVIIISMNSANINTETSELADRGRTGSNAQLSSSAQSSNLSRGLILAPPLDLHNPNTMQHTVSNQNIKNPALRQQGSNSPLQLTQLSTYMQQGKLTNWNEMRNCFKQMILQTAYLQSQDMPHPDIALDHFFIDSHGKMWVMDLAQSNIRKEGIQQNPNKAPEPNSHAALQKSLQQLGNTSTKNYALNLGLILFEICTGQSPNHIVPPRGQTVRQQALDGTLKFPPHVPEDLQQVMTALLQLKPPAQLDVVAVLNMLHISQTTLPPPSPLALPPPLSAAHLNKDLGTQTRISSQKESLPSILPLPSSTLLVSNSPMMNPKTSNEEDDEEEEQEGKSIRAVVFSSKILKDLHHIDSEFKPLIDALKNNRTKVNLLVQDQGKHADLNSLFDALLCSSELGLDKFDWRAFDALKNALDLPADEILFIDVNPEAAQAAKIMGFDAFVFSSPIQLKEELRKRNLINNTH